MNLFFRIGAVCFTALAALASGAAEVPSYEEMKSRIRQDHPRLFIHKETLATLRERALGPCKDHLKEHQDRIDARPDLPKLELALDQVDFDGDKIVIHRKLGNQNQARPCFKYIGGYEAAACALLYHVTGDRKYVEKGYRYMMLLIDFCRICRNSRIMPEWYNDGRLCGLVAYDWLYNELTPEQRKNFIVPMLDYLEHMRKPGYQRNGGMNVNTGNYGESGLWWYAGIAAYKNGFADDLAEKFLRDGWRHNTNVLNYRDQIANGQGLLSSICTGYSFGAYPWATNLFIHGLQTACDIDGTKIWNQPAAYANFFNWMCIVNDDFKDKIGDFGWGDAFHMTNNLGTWLMYTHLAYGIHFYGDNEESRALMSILPEDFQQIMYRSRYPWVIFGLTNFDPSKKFTGDPNKVLNRKTAEFFSTYGMLNMRSGIGQMDTYASIKAGAIADGHQHYDELHFTIYKKGFQALDSGIRCNAPHHAVYYPQTVAHNSLLIRMENEPIAPYWYPANAARYDRTALRSDGGQFRRKAAVNLGVDIGELHAATVGDATLCYTPQKCKEAVRHFVYVKPDYFIVYDRLTSVRPDQQKVFLLHSQQKPEQLNGVWKSRGGKGALFVKTVLPADARTELIGGPGKEFWTNGRNYPVDAGYQKQVAKLGGTDKTWLGTWRMEISPGKPALQDRFLTVMQAADGKAAAMVPVQNVSDLEFDAVRFTTHEGITVTAKFRRNGKIQGFLKLEKEGKVLLDKALNPPADVQKQPAAPRGPVSPRDVARIDFLIPHQELTVADKGSARSTNHPRWMKPGKGVVATFAVRDQAGNITLKAGKGGPLRIAFRGPDIRENGKKVPCWVAFTSCIVNGRELLKAPVNVWHDQPAVLTCPAQDGEILKIETKFRKIAAPVK